MMNEYEVNTKMWIKGDDNNGDVGKLHHKMKERKTVTWRRGGRRGGEVEGGGWGEDVRTVTRQEMWSKDGGEEEGEGRGRGRKGRE